MRVDKTEDGNNHGKGTNEREGRYEYQCINVVSSPA